MIHVIAIVKTKPGKREEVLNIFRSNVPAVHAEDGCIEYQAVVDVDDANQKFGDDAFVVVEKWRDRDALRAHAASSHMAAYGSATSSLVENVAVHVMRPDAA